MQPWARIAGEQRAHLPGVDALLAGLLEVDAEPEVVLDLDEQVGEPDQAAAGVQPAVELGEAVRLRRVGLLGRVRLQPPPVVVERDLPVVSDTFQEPVERTRQTCLQLLDRRSGIDGEPGSRPELLPPRGGHRKNASNRPKFFAPSMARLPVWISSRTLREQRALPAAAVRHAVMADERLQRRRGEVERRIGRNAAARPAARCSR